MENKLQSLTKRIKVKTLIEKIVPTLESNKTKGENGVVGIVGGSIEYTGAPYYSGISALKSGCDLSHVFCHKEAALPIKSYSPELIVHPGFDEDGSNQNLLSKTARWFKSMDCLVFGPGLGREASTFQNFTFLLEESLKVDKSINIIDADGLWHLMNSDVEKIIKSDSRIILTPNLTEFNRLVSKFINEEENTSNTKISYSNTYNIPEEELILEQDEVIFIENFSLMLNFKREARLTNYLNNKVLVKKGKVDLITDGKSAYLVKNIGSLKRCGGIGDILNGVIATFCSMKKKQGSKIQGDIDNQDLLDICALACFVTKEAARKAFTHKGYSLTAPDVIEELSIIAKDYSL
jgi:ATP-dependent NAD(P)H-hydrate dehydratase